MRPLVIVTPAHKAPFAPPKDRKDISPLVDWSQGGINLNDGTQGLQIQDWNFTVEGNGSNTGIYLTSATYPKTLQIARPNIVWARGSFDQNMHPAIAYTAGSLSYLWWWDSVTHQQLTTVLGSASSFLSPTVVMDDTRPRETDLGNNDIVLAYLRSGELYFRLQRDRYGVEHLWYSGAFPDYIESPYINRMGINLEWRFQLEFHDRMADYPE